MIPAPFDYVRADSVDDAIARLREDPEGKLLAGGHSLLPAMKLRLARPSTLIDIGRLRDLAYIREDGDRVAIGALTRHHDVATSELLRQACPIVAHAASVVGDPQVRHVGTIGGSCAHGDPAGDLPSVLLALEAEFVARGPSGERTIPASGFFTSLFETALAPDEVLTEIRVPRTSGGWAYLKFNRRAIDWAIVGVAAVRANGGVRVGLTNMGLTPLRATGVEEAIASGADPAAAAARADEGTAPPADAFASDEYRRELAKVLVRRALEQVLA
ncbi:MAG: carbon-monoxide dehydrogenase medium subunit [Actinomycetota bacterium]|jgi:carbon-monoxide dehydrogenase medium subunit|nr:MAG: carbon-monoxide dehydrogenase medium subunit [Actinomycetota bacterium]